MYIHIKHLNKYIFNKGTDKYWIIHNLSLKKTLQCTIIASNTYLHITIETRIIQYENI